MQRKIQGYYETVSTVGETVKAFVPAPLPPVPAVHWSPELLTKFHKALQEIGNLDKEFASGSLTDPSLFIYMYVRKEAVLSSMIEGTQSSLSDLLLFELEQEPGAPLDDVQEVSNYVEALNYGLKRLASGFPMSLRLLQEIHAVLMKKGRGSKQAPGKFRRIQNWIGGTRPGNAVFVPPPPQHIQGCMNALELFLHDQPEPTPPLLKAALAHVQFETIHPFLDGNGRLGRLLITLLLCEQKVLQKPVLYLSLYFKMHRQHYYELLNAVRFTGDWESWLDFFAEAVIETARQAEETVKRLKDLINRDYLMILTLGRAADSTHEIHRVLKDHPIATAGFLVKKTGISAATVNKCLRHLEQLGIVCELTSRKRNRIFSYSKYIEILNQGTEKYHE